MDEKHKKIIKEDIAPLVKQGRLSLYLGAGYSVGTKVASGTTVPSTGQLIERLIFAADKERLGEQGRPTLSAEEFGAEQSHLRKLHGKQGPKKTRGVVIQKFSGEGDIEKKEEEQVPEPPPTEHTHFEERYQSWYSRALTLMKQLAQDRYAEFQSFYVVDPRYPWGDTTAYVIQDYFRNRESDDAGGETARCFKNQLAILKSVGDRVDWMALDTEDQAGRSLQLAELETARDLIKISERAAGALAGTVLQTFLAALAQKHKLKFRKHAPSSRDYAEALKTANVLDVPAWSQCIWLSEIQDRSIRSDGEGPTKAQVRDLIDGTHWLVTNIF